MAPERVPSGNGLGLRVLSGTEARRDTELKGGRAGSLPLSPHLPCICPLHTSSAFALTPALLSRAYCAHSSDVEPEVQRSRVANLESCRQKVKVQGSGPETQAGYLDPCQITTVKTAGTQRSRSSPNGPQCVLPVPTHRTTGLAPRQSAERPRVFSARSRHC